MNSANKKWRKENHGISYQDYHAFADDFLKTDSVNHTLVTVNQDELSALHSRCKSQGVSINDYLLAKMFSFVDLSTINKQSHAKKIHLSGCLK